LLFIFNHVLAMSAYCNGGHSGHKWPLLRIAMAIQTCRSEPVDMFGNIDADQSLHSKWYQSSPPLAETVS